MSRKYEDEQSDIDTRIKSLKAELEQKTDKSMTTGGFIATVRKYTRGKKLTPRMLNELVYRIEVRQFEKIDGIHRQELTIYYNCIGFIEIHDREKLEKPSIIMQTRCGMTVGYTPREKGKENTECSL